MRFSTFIVLAGALATTVCADKKGLESQLSSYVEAQKTAPAWSSVHALLATKTEASKSYDAFQTSIASVIAHSGTIKSNYLQALPTEIRPVYSSFIAAQISIASKNGFVLAIEGAPTSVAKGAAPTAKPAAVGAALIAGLLGVAAL